MDSETHRREAERSVHAAAKKEGTSHPRRLQEKGVDGPPEERGLPVTSATEGENTGRRAWAKGGGRPPATAAVEWKERRGSPRIRCSGSVELRAQGKNVRKWGTLTDISLHGCYVELNDTYSVDTKVDLVMKSFGIRIVAPGTVCTSYPFLGMGICFGEIKPEESVHLKQLIDALAGHHSAPPDRGHAREEHEARGAVALSTPGDLLRDITEFFESNQKLSREDFRKMVEQLRQP